MLVARIFRRALLSGAARSEYYTSTATGSSTSTKTTDNPLEEFFELNRNLEDEKPIVYDFKMFLLFLKVPLLIPLPRKMSSLLGLLIQLVKTGFTKAAQRLDGTYALLAVAKIAALDIKAEETLSKEKIWLMISQNEPSLVSISLVGARMIDTLIALQVSKLAIEDSIACVDLLELLLCLICHPSWNVRKVAYDASEKILSASPQLSEGLLLTFTSFLLVVGERTCLLRASDEDFITDAQVPFLPSVEVLVKALLVISSPSLIAGPNACSQLIFCSHHPCIVSTMKKDAVWRRLRSSLQSRGCDVISFVTADLENILVPNLYSQEDEARGAQAR
ncbi:hypothetical protein GIB67_021246, partial [Kingdonia uniflora]